MGLHDAAADGQAQTLARRVLPGPFGLDAGKLLEEPLQLARLQPLPLVGDRDGHIDVLQPGGHADGGPVRGVLGGVGEQVVEHLEHPLAVGAHLWQARGQVDLDDVAGAAAEEGVAGQLEDVGHLGGLGAHREHAGLDAGHVEEVVDQVAHPVGLLVDDAEELAGLGAIEGEHGAQGGGGGALDGGQGGPQFVADHAQELRPLPLQLLPRPHVLHHEDDGGDVAIFRVDWRGAEENRETRAVILVQHKLLGAHTLAAVEGAEHRPVVCGNGRAVHVPDDPYASDFLQTRPQAIPVAGNPLRLLVDGDDGHGLGVEHHDAHRRQVHQRFQVGPGMLLTAVVEGVGDGHGGLGGEHSQDFLVFLGELALPLSQR